MRRHQLVGAIDLGQQMDQGMRAGTESSKLSEGIGKKASAMRNARIAS